MKLSDESLSSRWAALVLLWAIATGLLFFHASLVKQYLGLVGNLGVRGTGHAITPLDAAYPAFAPDAQTWVRHALSLVEGDAIRLRFADIDNAPHGREVHWNSAWAWTIALAGLINHWITDEPIARSVEQAIIWLTPSIFLLLVVVGSFWVSRRAGVVAGVFIGLAMVGHPRVAEGFFPGYADHHGLLSVAVMGAVLGAIFTGAGWWREQSTDLSLYPDSLEAARRAAVFSALSGAFGMWVSAASTIPPLAIIGCGAILTIFVGRRWSARESLRFDPGVWRLWGRVGGSASLLAYLLEYFPNHLGFRLESNHPFYAIAWVAGGELIAQFGQRWLGPAGETWHSPQRLLLPLLGLLVAPITILLAREKVFVVADPFLAELHHSYIQEFLPLWKSFSNAGWTTFFNVVGPENIPLFVGAIVMVVMRRNCPLLLVFATVTTLMFTGMAWMQARWMLNASGSQIALALVLLANFTRHRSVRVRFGAALVGVFLVFWPTVFSRLNGALEDIANRRVAPKDANSALFRDIAATLRASAPKAEIVLLTQPNASTGVGYYGRFKTLGTLYWENVAGLKSAARIFSARSDQEAAELIRQHRVTHIAIISEENFIEQYNRLLYPNITDAELRKSFGFQLFIDRSIPPWLQMIPYKAPTDLSSLKMDVLLFKVAFDQSPADALYHLAMGKLTLGAVMEAERDIDTLIQRTPESSPPWLRKAELLFARQEWSAAVDAMINGISRAPAAERPSLFANAASSFYRAQRASEAAKLYRAALADRYDAQIAAYLAFLLATAIDESLHNPTEALALADKARRVRPNSPTVLNAWAAALAENDRFEEAVAAAEQALKDAKRIGDQAAIQVSTQRIKVYRAGKRLRE